MLTIHPVINQNYRMKPAFGERPDLEELDVDSNKELENAREEYKKGRQQWLNRRSEMQEMVDDENAPVAKPMKKILQVGIIGSAAALGALGTGYSAKYIIEKGQEIAKSKQVKNLTKGFKKRISTPIAKGFEEVREFAKGQIAKVKKSETYKTGAEKLKQKKESFKNTSFARFFSKNAEKISANKYVQKVTGFVDGIFSGIGEGVVKLYNKLAGVNYKNATANTLGAAGGISTGAAAMMEQKAEADKLKNQEVDFECID